MSTLSATVDSVSTTKSFGVIITDPCSSTVYSIDPIADISAIIPNSDVI